MKDLIEKTAQRMIYIKQDGFKEECPISIIDINKWEWAQGVGIYGMYLFWEFSGDVKYYNFIKGWFDARIAEGLPEKNVNTCAPMLTLTFLYEKTKDEKYKALISEWAEYVMNFFPRTEDRGLQHIVSGNENYAQLWTDTLFMTNLFLARAGVVLGRDDYINESKHQLLVHIKYLFDKKSGLWYHGWSFLRKDNFAGAHWGRGNCWFTVCSVDYIDYVSCDPYFKDYLIDTLRAQADALLKYQTKSGMWRTIVDDEDSYEEASATAGFAYGLLKAVRMGYIDEKYEKPALKALFALKDHISEDGTVQAVSYGTPVFENAEDYKKIECCPMTYGQALAVLCMTEGLKHNIE